LSSDSHSNSLTVQFGKRLARLRSDRKMTQERLAEAASISPDFLSLIERGLRSPSFNTLKRLSSALGVPVRALFDFEA
jgi:transcriptional regulator with XRE-family HTH domain